VQELPRRAIFPDFHVPGQPGATLANNHERSTGPGTFHGPADITFPTLVPYRPTTVTKSAQTSLIVLPGGAYKFLSHGRESSDVCKFFVMRSGVTCFVVFYRVPFSVSRLPWGVPPLIDAQRAVGLVRQNLSAEFQLDPRRVGVLGLSAGGLLVPELFVTCGGGGGETPRAYARIDSADDVTCRPDFSVMIYPFYLACSANAAPARQFDKETLALLSSIIGWPGVDLDEPVPSGKREANTPLPGYLYTGRATMTRLPACSRGWTPDSVGSRTSAAVINPAAVPPAELLGHHPPTFIAAESTDPVAMVGGEVYLCALRNASRPWHFRADEPFEAYSVQRSDRAELHIWNSSNAHGQGARCAMSRVHMPTHPRPEEGMCKAWPFLVETWLARRAFSRRAPTHT
jgi:acetyl esterase/lipase